MSTPSPTRRVRSDLSSIFSRSHLTAPCLPTKPSTAEGPTLASLLTPRQTPLTIISDSAVSEASHDPPSTPPTLFHHPPPSSSTSSHTHTPNTAKTISPQLIHSRHLLAPVPIHPSDNRPIRGFESVETPQPRCFTNRLSSSDHDNHSPLLHPSPITPSTDDNFDQYALNSCPTPLFFSAQKPCPTTVVPKPQPSTPDSKLSWHRTRSEVVTVSRTDTNPIDNSTTTTTTTTKTVTMIPIGPRNFRTKLPISTSAIPGRRRDARLSHRKHGKAASHLGMEFSRAMADENEMAQGEEPLSLNMPGVGAVRAHEKRRRRRSSYLTGAFVRRKGGRFGRLQPEYLNDPTLIRRREVDPVYPRIPLKEFGRVWYKDAVTLYTNSLRAELNDLVFMTTCLQSTFGLDHVEQRGKHKNVQVDFELWFSRFSQYAELSLKGFEHYYFPFVTDSLHQRDVMLSRAVAAMEAGGRSYVQAWGSQSLVLSDKMEEVRDLLSTLGSRVLMLQQSRFTSNDNCADLVKAVCESIRILLPAFVELLDAFDKRFSALLRLNMDTKKVLKTVHTQFANLLTREGKPPLGWAGITLATRWIEERKIRSEYVSAMAKASRQSLFTRYRSDNSHHTIIKIHRMIVGEDGRRRSFFQ